MHSIYKVTIINDNTFVGNNASLCFDLNKKRSRNSNEAKVNSNNGDDVDVNYHSLIPSLLESMIDLVGNFSDVFYSGLRMNNDLAGGATIS